MSSQHIHRGVLGWGGMGWSWPLFYVLDFVRKDHYCPGSCSCERHSSFSFRSTPGRLPSDQALQRKRQTDRQTDRQAGRQADTQRDRDRMRSSETVFWNHLKPLFSNLYNYYVKWIFTYLPAKKCPCLLRLVLKTLGSQCQAFLINYMHWAGLTYDRSPLCVITQMTAVESCQTWTLSH